MARARGKARVRIVYNHFPKIAKQFPKACLEIVTETLVEMDRIVKTGMAAGKSGRVYGDHQASAPGEMPAVDLNNLRASLTMKLDQRKVSGIYYTNVDYAPHLEFGTTKMLARPFMTPAAEEARKFFIGELKKLERRLR